MKIKQAKIIMKNIDQSTTHLYDDLVQRLLHDHEFDGKLDNEGGDAVQSTHFFLDSVNHFLKGVREMRGALNRGKLPGNGGRVGYTCERAQDMCDTMKGVSFEIMMMHAMYG